MSVHDPREDFDEHPWREGRAAGDSLRWPAIVIGVFGLIQLVVSGFALILVVVFLIAALLRTESVEDVELSNRILVAAGAAAAVIWNALIVRGASDMQQLRRYRWAVAACARSLVAVPFIYFAIVSIPLGAFALVVLVQSDVRDRFAVVERGAVDPTPPSTEPAPP